MSTSDRLTCSVRATGRALCCGTCCSGPRLVPSCRVETTIALASCCAERRSAADKDRDSYCPKEAKEGARKWLMFEMALVADPQAEIEIVFSVVLSCGAG